MQVRLTAGFVLSAAKPTDEKDRVIYWDERRPGFGLMVTSRGQRSYVFQYRDGLGESRRASLSGSTKLADAHKWADILQGDIAKGVEGTAKRRPGELAATNCRASSPALTRRRTDEARFIARRRACELIDTLPDGRLFASANHNFHIMNIKASYAKRIGGFSR